MLKKSSLKILLLVVIIFLSMGFLNDSQEELIAINPEGLNFYQENLCKFTIFKLLNVHDTDIKLELRNDPSGSVECFGKNSWSEYTPPKPVKNELNVFEEEKITIWIATNQSVDILLQSLFWLILFSYIPKTNKIEIKKKCLLVLLNTIIFYLHLIGEKDYYKNFSREFDIDIISKEYSGELYYQNYYLYIYLFAVALISFICIYLLESRFNNLINYSPFIFLIYGTYAGLNLNIYLIILCLIGLNSVINKGLNKKFTFIYFIFTLFWIINLNQKNFNFDVDKLRGFVNSSQSLISLIYWSVMFYFLINGITSLIKTTREFYNLNKFKRNLIITGSLIFIFGNLSAISTLFNFFSYYFLGLNKFGMRSVESIGGNTWRGIAPSAEGIGEFFAFVLLFLFINLFEKKLKLNLTEIVLLPFIILGLIRSNNFAATSSFLIIVVLYILLKKFKGLKLALVMSFLSILMISIVYSVVFKEFSYENLSNRIFYEAVSASEIDYIQETNQYGWDQAKQANYQYILEIPREKSNLSTSLRFSLEQYTYNNIENLPSILSIINIGSYFINRSEKWGIFLAKYNPDKFQFLFGYGPQQFTQYYFEHPTKYNYGLFLPHSSLMNYLIFFGIFGLLILFSVLYSQIKNYKFNLQFKFLIFYFVLNLIKSDALFYLPNLILFLIIIYLPNIKENL